jgi:rSAM/selenodomain-associated transferase 1
MRSSRNLYAVLLKYPEAGRVKSRLSKDIGEKRAAEIYRETAEGVLKRTRPQSGSYERIIFFSPPDAGEEIKEWLPGERLIPQCGDDLGAIMNNAFREMFALGALKALLTGTDIPELDGKIVSQGFSELDRSDVVIGPARDGGYYLIGMKSQQPRIFHHISWGSGDVLHETLSRVKELNLTFSVLTQLRDLDRAEDLASLGRLRKSGECQSWS